MATNYELLSASSSDSSASSGDDSPLGASDADRGGRVVVDLTYHDLDAANVDVNLADMEPDQRAKIRKVLLYNNRLASVPLQLTACTNITVLDLSNNAIHIFPVDMTGLTQLTHLYLRNNLLADESFPKDLSSLSKLQDLNLSGNHLTEIPQSLLQLTALRNLFLGGNRLTEIPPGIKVLKRLRVFYLGGNELRFLPPEISQLSHLHALILCNNRLQLLPEAICSLRRLQCLQLHENKLTTLPQGLVHLSGLAELSLRGNPLVVRFVRQMTLQPSSLLELAARIVNVEKIPYSECSLPRNLLRYLSTAHCCVNPACAGVYFQDNFKDVKFVDFCGKYKIPLMQYLCSSRCHDGKPAHPPSAERPAEDEELLQMKRVLLG